MVTLPSANEMMAKLALMENEKASAAQKAREAEEKEKKELLDKMSGPSGLSDEQLLEKASIIITRAVENSRTSVQVYRFPNTLCTDNGRAINQREGGWEKTLTGAPKELYGFWQRQLKSRGYHLHYEVVDFPGGMPGDIGVSVSWD